MGGEGRGERRKGRAGSVHYVGVVSIRSGGGGGERGEDKEMGGREEQGEREGKAEKKKKDVDAEAEEAGKRAGEIKHGVGDTCMLIVTRPRCINAIDSEVTGTVSRRKQQ